MQGEKDPEIVKRGEKDSEILIKIWNPTIFGIANTTEKTRPFPLNLPITNENKATIFMFLSYFFL